MDRKENDLKTKNPRRIDLKRMDLSRKDLSRNDLSRNNLGRNDLGRNDLRRIDGKWIRTVRRRKTMLLAAACGICFVYGPTAEAKEVWTGLPQQETETAYDHAWEPSGLQVYSGADAQRSERTDLSENPGADVQGNEKTDLPEDFGADAQEDERTDLYEDPNADESENRKTEGREETELQSGLLLEFLYRIDSETAKNMGIEAGPILSEWICRENQWFHLEAVQYSCLPLTKVLEQDSEWLAPGQEWAAEDYLTKDGIEYRKKEVREESSVLSDRPADYSAEQYYFSREEIPARIGYDAADRLTGESFYTELPLAYVAEDGYDWQQDLRLFPITFVNYGNESGEYTIGDNTVILQGEDPAFEGFQEILMEFKDLDPSYTVVTGLYWDGEPYLNDQGISCRDAMAVGDQIRMRYRAGYSGLVNQPELTRVRYLVTYESEPYAYEMHISARYEPSEPFFIRELLNLYGTDITKYTGIPANTANTANTVKQTDQASASAFGRNEDLSGEDSGINSIYSEEKGIDPALAQTSVPERISVWIRDNLLILLILGTAVFSAFLQSLVWFVIFRQRRFVESGRTEN